MVLLLFATLTLPSLALAAPGDEFLVKIGGPDGFDTIAAALDSITDRDLVRRETGLVLEIQDSRRYVEMVVIPGHRKLDGGPPNGFFTSADYGLTLRAVPGQVPVIQAPYTAGDANYAIRLRYSNHVTLEGLTVEGAGLDSRSVGIYLEGTRYVTVRRCKVRKVSREAIWLYTAFGSRLEDNDLSDASDGILRLDEYCQQNVVINNRIHSTRFEFPDFGPGVRAAGIRVSGNHTRDNRIEHNTIFNASIGLWIDSQKALPKELVFRHNIVFDAAPAGSLVLQIDGPIPPGLVMDRNDLFSAGPVLAKVDGRELRDLAEWQAESGLDGDSISANPRFISSAREQEDFRLSLHSPCRDLGAYGGSGDALVQPRPRFELRGAPALAHKGKHFWVTVSALDPNGSYDPSYSGAVVLETNDPAGLVGGSPGSIVLDFVPADQGSKQVRIELRSPGLHFLAATDLEDRTLTGGQRSGFVQAIKVLNIIRVSKDEDGGDFKTIGEALDWEGLRRWDRLEIQDNEVYAENLRVNKQNNLTIAAAEGAEPVLTPDPDKEPANGFSAIFFFQESMGGGTVLEDLTLRGGGGVNNSWVNSMGLVSYNRDPLPIVVRNCRIVDFYGGNKTEAFWIADGASAVFEGCLFKDNGRTLFEKYKDFGSLDLINCSFVRQIENSVTGTRVLNCAFQQDEGPPALLVLPYTTVENCLFSGHAPVKISLARGASANQVRGCVLSEADVRGFTAESGPERWGSAAPTPGSGADLGGAGLLISEVHWDAPPEQQWLELHNPNPVVFRLGGYSLGNGASCYYWRIPEGTEIPAGGRLLIHLRGSAGDDTADEIFMDAGRSSLEGYGPLSIGRPVGWQLAWDHGSYVSYFDESYPGQCSYEGYEQTGAGYYYFGAFPHGLGHLPGDASHGELSLFRPGTDFGDAIDRAAMLVDYVQWGGGRDQHPAHLYAGTAASNGQWTSAVAFVPAVPGSSIQLLSRPDGAVTVGKIAYRDSSDPWEPLRIASFGDGLNRGRDITETHGLGVADRSLVEPAINAPRNQYRDYDAGPYEFEETLSHSVRVRGIAPKVFPGEAQDLTIEVYDALGNLDTGFVGTVRFGSSAPAILPADYAFVPADRGRKSFPGGLNFADGVKGWQRVIATAYVDGRLVGDGVQGDILVETRFAVTATLGGKAYPSIQAALDDIPKNLVEQDLNPVVELDDNVVYSEYIQLANFITDERHQIVIRGRPGKKPIVRTPYQVAGRATTIHVYYSDWVRIEDLIIEGNIVIAEDGVTARGDSIGVFIEGSRNVEVSNCLIRYHSHGGVILYGAVDCRILGNKVMDCSSVSLQLRQYCTDNLVQDNWIHYSYFDYQDFGEKGRGKGVQVEGNWTQRNVIDSNVIFNATLGLYFAFRRTPEQPLGSPPPNNTFTNNIVYDADGDGGSYVLMSDGPIPEGTVLDRNDYYSIGPTAMFSVDGVESMDLAEWKALSGQDAGSYSADPRFLSTSRDGENFGQRPDGPHYDDAGGLVINDAPPAFRLVFDEDLLDEDQWYALTIEPLDASGGPDPAFEGDIVLELYDPSGALEPYDESRLNSTRNVAGTIAPDAGAVVYSPDDPAAAAYTDNAPPDSDYGDADPSGPAYGTPALGKVAFIDRGQDPARYTRRVVIDASWKVDGVYRAIVYFGSAGFQHIRAADATNAAREGMASAVRVRRILRVAKDLENTIAEFDNFNDAIDVAQDLSWDVIEILDSETYREHVRPGKSNLWFRAARGQKPVLAPFHMFRPAPHLLKLQWRKGYIFEGLTFRGFRSEVKGIYAEDSGDIRFSDCTIEGFAGENRFYGKAMHMERSFNVLIERCVFRYNGFALRFRYKGTYTVRNCEFFENAWTGVGWGVGEHDGAKRVDLQNCSFFQTDGYPIVNVPPFWTITNCILEPALETAMPDEVKARFDHCLLPAGTDLTGFGEGCLAADARYLDSSLGDLRVPSFSPAVNAGRDLRGAEVLDDIRHGARPSETDDHGADIGAHEFLDDGSFDVEIVAPTIGPNRSVLVGDRMTVRVVAYDRFGEPDPGYRGTVRFSTNRATSKLPEPYTFTAEDAGRASFQYEIMFQETLEHHVTVDDVSEGLDLVGVMTPITALSPLDPPLGWGEKVYSDRLFWRWSNGTWADYNAYDTDQVHSGNFSFSVWPNKPWSGIYFFRTWWTSPFDPEPYEAIQFFFNGGNSDKHKVWVKLVLEGGRIQNPVDIRGFGRVVKGEWTLVSIPLAYLGVTPGKRITGLFLQSNSFVGSKDRERDSFYIDRLQFVLKGTIPPDPPSHPAELPVYTDQVGRAWVDGSWAPVDLANTEQVYEGAYAAKIDLNRPWNGMFLMNRGVTDYDTLRFFLHGGPSGGQDFWVRAIVGAANGNFEDQVWRPGVYIRWYGRPRANEWTEYRIPLSHLGAEGKLLRGIAFQEAKMALTATFPDPADRDPQPPFWMDSMTLLDTGDPRVQAASSPDGRSLTITFSEGMRRSTVEDPANFEIRSIPGGPTAPADPNYRDPRKASAAAYDFGTNTVVLNVPEPLDADAVYQVVPGGVQDAHGRDFVLQDEDLDRGTVVPQKAEITIDPAVDSLEDGAPPHRISPYIYGANFGDKETIREIGLRFSRAGGNRWSRQNWEINCDNAAADFEFANGGDPSADPGAWGSSFLQRGLKTGLGSCLTIPMLGWVAKDNYSRSRVFSEAAGARDPGVIPEDTSIRSFPEKRRFPDDPFDPGELLPYEYPPNIADGHVYVDEYVHFLVERFGRGQPMFLGLGNEPDLWGFTHRDVHPLPSSYDELLGKYLAYSQTMRRVAPDSRLVGPVSTGWFYYWSSARGNRDRLEHGNIDFLPWFLGELKAHDEGVQAGNSAGPSPAAAFRIETLVLVASTLELSGKARIFGDVQSNGEIGGFIGNAFVEGTLAARTFIKRQAGSAQAGAVVTGVERLPFPSEPALLARIDEETFYGHQRIRDTEFERYAYVYGDVTISGSSSGKGIIIATGDITLEGDARFESATGGLALYSRSGRVILRGKAEVLGSIAADRVTIEGNAVVRPAPARAEPLADPDGGDSGYRSLDVLDLHYYAEPGYLTNMAIDGVTNRQRIASTRSLWDPTWTDESWLGQVQPGKYSRQPDETRLQLIPRMKKLLADHYYSDTKLGFSEYDWGVTQTIMGGICQADVLGVFGKHEVYFGARWSGLRWEQPDFNAFKLFGNYDGNATRLGRRFGDLSIKAVSTLPNVLDVYASRVEATGELRIVVINKDPFVTLNPKLRLAGYRAWPVARAFGFDRNDPGRVRPLFENHGEGGATFPPADGAEGIPLIRNIAWDGLDSVVDLSFAPYSVTLIEVLPFESGGLLAPPPIRELELVSTDASSATLRWDAPRALVATAQPIAGYRLRWRERVPRQDPDWSLPSDSLDVPATAAPGLPETFTVGGLEAGKLYDFAVEPLDGAGQAFEASNPVFAETEQP